MRTCLECSLQTDNLINEVLKMKNTYLAVLPFFGGFFHSTHSHFVDMEAEAPIQDDHGDIIEAVSDSWTDCVEWSDAYKQYSELYTEALTEYTEAETDKVLDMTFESLVSPRFYNFGTDRLFVDISEKTVYDMLWNMDFDILAKLIKGRFTSCDGFISHYPNSLDQWENQTIEELDHNELGTIVEAYLMSIGFDTQELDRDIAMHMYENGYLQSLDFGEEYNKMVNEVFNQVGEAA